MNVPRTTRPLRVGRLFASLATRDLHAKRMAFPPAADESYTELSSPRKIFVQVLRGRLCFRGVSWLLLCTSKEVTRSAAGRAEALLLETNRANNGRAEALLLWRAKKTAC